jgi:hypothetical protein
MLDNNENDNKKRFLNTILERKKKRMKMNMNELLL